MSSASGPIDQLTEPGSPSGLVIVNYGDPAYRHQLDNTQGLSRAEAISLRLVAYLLFADNVSIPTRHVLEGEDMAHAVSWLSPLLDEGILVPERRAGVSSFEEIVTVRQLPEISKRRAELLDRHAKVVRSFRFDSLAATYLDLLNSDLDVNGALRRTVPGG